MKHDKAAFNPSGPFVARKPFSFQGESIQQGGPFPFLKLGCSMRKLRQLWDNGFIVPAGSLPEAPVETAITAVVESEANPTTTLALGESQPAGLDEAEAKARAEAKAKAEKRREAGRKAAETRKAKNIPAKVPEPTTEAPTAAPVLEEAVEVSED